MRVWDNEPEDFFDEINIIPTIDVIFAILTFFILSPLFLTQAEEFEVMDVLRTIEGVRLGIATAPKSE
ncbi:MAG: hypothetical protein J7647_23405 [Cyanobacteria bacterium SBLK]|nr:hypothetical protein [Cyanobacteria bacterium SBLK]